MTSNTENPAWTPFQRVSIDMSEFDTPEAHARYNRLADADENPEHDAEFYRQTYMSLGNDECYINSRYQVFVRRTMVEDGEGGVKEMVHLSVKRRDQKTIHDWRDMQQIKHELLGAECEAIELYPAASREVDTANQYHLWGVRDPNFRWPVGWHEGRRIDAGAQDDINIGARQRAFEPEMNLDDLKIVDYRAAWQRLQAHLIDLVSKGNVDQQIVDWMYEIEEGVETLS